MALFERPSQQHILPLLRIGFAARLRSELANIYISHDVSGKLHRTDNREKSTLFYFLSGDTATASAARDASFPFCAQAAVLARLSPTAESAAFLTLSESHSSLSDSPMLLKVSLETAPHAGRLLFSLSTVGPRPRYISFLGVGRGRPLVSVRAHSKHALFHFEIEPSSLGKGFLPNPVYTNEFLTPPQALVQAILQLGVRFRIRSVHSTLLTRRARDAESPLKTAVAVHLDASPIDPDSLSLSAFQMVRLPIPHDPASRLYHVCDEASGRPLSVRRSLSSATAATVVLTRADREKAKVLLRVACDAWGSVSLGVSVDDVDAAGTNGRLDGSLWLMAGPRGRLEVRAHRGNWETFGVEVVAQSFNAAVGELPSPALYRVAEEVTRAGVRAEIQQRVSDTTKRASTGALRASVKGGFNHSAALAALADDDASPSNSRKNITVRSPKGKAKGQGAESKKLQIQNARAVATASAGAASALPRNVASKKAAKKNKKRNRKNAAKAKKAGTSMTSSAANSRASGVTTAASSVNSLDKSSTSGDDASSTDGSSTSNLPEEGARTSQTKAGASGPPCSACGRALTGQYTTALGRKFHPYCFCCGHCRRPMGSAAGQFRERSGIPYCESCFAAHHASRCARCSQPILETVVTAMEKTWHKNCLTCVLCRLPVTETFWLFADRPNEPRCSRCVTGEEHARFRGAGNHRMVNLPGFGAARNQAAPFSGGTSEMGRLPTLGDSGQQGRARLQSPVFPVPTQR